MSECTEEWAVALKEHGIGYGTYRVIVKRTRKILIEYLTEQEATDIVLRWNAALADAKPQAAGKE